MSDLSLLWLHLGQIRPDLTREGMQALCERLGMEWEVRQTTATAFRVACTGLRTTYHDAASQPWTLRAELVKRTADFATYAVQRVQDGLQLGELKYFAPRRGREGIVEGSAQLKWVLRKNLSPDHEAGAMAWIEQATARYEGAQTQINPLTVRRRLEMAITEDGVPIIDRTWMFFLYADAAGDVADLVRQYLEATTVGSQVEHVLISDQDNYSTFARSADAHLVARCEAIERQIARTVRVATGLPTGRMRARYMATLDTVKFLLARHERRLGHELVSARGKVALTEQTIQGLAPRKRLP